tara:strand:- start:787 stop:2085 length:1299 start_codon:yes stop_codon:yes gene_type:complete
VRYYSLKRKSPDVSFQEAVLNGLAPDRSLYFPESISILPKKFFQNIDQYSNEEIAYKAIKQFIGDEIPKEVLKYIIKDTLHFDFPIIPINDSIVTLELFHGPTMSFKDIGASFMARCLGYFNRKNNNKLTVLVATSGDTGGAVAHGFLGIKGIEVVIVYPSGKVSDIQERQLTTFGQNITAIELDGYFDDCQEMVKKSFLDNKIKRKLTSANSINIARWLPQMFYYFIAYKKVYKQKKEVIFSVPSGNFGNICAAIMAKRLGLPIKHFIASTNINDTVPNYLANGVYNPKPSKNTISNAMDVGNPSNFIRIQQLFDNDLNLMKNSFSAYSFTDKETKNAMKQIYNNSKYLADPHGAVGYLGAKLFQKKHSKSLCIFLETAHPVKFMDIIKETLSVRIAIPEQIKSVLEKEKKSIKIKTYEELKRFLNSEKLL